MDNDEVIERTAAHVRELMQGESSGHDWWHVYRVWQTANTIARHEQVELAVVELAALLHDIADWKFHGGDTTAGPRAARAWLLALGVEEEIIAHVCQIIQDLSFKGAGVPDMMVSRVGMVVQDADRLDALGAIGIARTFAYGGHMRHTMYDPEVEPQPHPDFEAYKTSAGTTINHFYEKLLLLKDRMHTDTARHMAQERHRFLLHFLERFFAEWEGTI